jgi:hypothetical protein
MQAEDRRRYCERAGMSCQHREEDAFKLSLMPDNRKSEALLHISGNACLSGVSPPLSGPILHAVCHCYLIQAFELSLSNRNIDGALKFLGRRVSLDLVRNLSKTLISVFVSRAKREAQKRWFPHSRDHIAPAHRRLGLSRVPKPLGNQIEPNCPVLALYLGSGIGKENSLHTSDRECVRRTPFMKMGVGRPNPRVSGRSRITGCAVKRWWSTAGIKSARELVRSTR